MRKQRLGWFLVFGVGALCVALFLKLQREPLRAAAPIGARLELAAGDVQVERDGVQGTMVSGMPLPDHTDLRTGKGARALLRLSGGGSAFLGDATRLQLSGAGVSLLGGRMWLDVPKLPQPVVHQLGFASVAVANAGLSIERRDDRIEVYVARGLAVVSAAKARREVAAGEHAIVTPAGDVSVEAVSFWDDWTGGMADRGVDDGLGGTGAGTLYAVDRGAPLGTPATTRDQAAECACPHRRRHRRDRGRPDVLESG